MGARLRAVWATAGSTPWRRAPVLLLRRPGVLGAVAGATMVMVAAVAAVPLFLSAAGSASVTLQAGERCPRDTGATRTEVVPVAQLRSAAPDPFAPLAGRLAPTNRWTWVEQVSLAGDERLDTTVVAREGARDHVELLDGGSGPGVWITDRAAKRTGLVVGGTARLGSIDVRVAAVYRDLAGYALDRFWCSNARSLLVQSRGGDLVLPPPVVLADRATVADLIEAEHYDEGVRVSEAGLAPGLTLAEARHLADDLACHGTHRRELSWCAPGQPLIERRFPRSADGGFRAADDGDFLERYFGSSLPFVLERSRATQTAVGSGIWPVAMLAALAGAGLVAAAASLWFDRRRRDVVLLSVRGVSPLGLGAKAVLELVLPLGVGAGAGIALSYGLVRWLGPSPDIEPAAVGRAGWAAIAALVGAVVTVASVVAARVRGIAVRTHRRLPLALVPWEVALVVAAAASYHRLGQWGVPVGQGADVSRADLWGLLFPVLFILAVVSVVARLLGFGLRPLRALTTRSSMPWFLAVRRVARARAASLGLLAATALAAGVLVYAATMGGSLHATLDAKARTFVGSDMEADVAEGQPVPASLAGRATAVGVHRDATLGGEPVTVLVVDPVTFTDGAYWDDTFADRSLPDIVDRLQSTGAAVTVGIDADGPTTLIVGQADGVELRVESVADVRAFPGMRRSRPTVYVARAALRGHHPIGGEEELWVAGDADRSRAALQRAGIAYKETRSATEVVDRAAFVTVSWTFGFMRSLGVAAGLLAIGGVAVHLDARRRERVLGHAFLRRMGLRPSQHRWALVVELVATVLVGCTVGVVAALVGADLAHGRIDPIPTFAPEPLLRLSHAAAFGSLAGAVLVVVVASLVAQRRTERDDAVEVLRAGA